MSDSSSSDSHRSPFEQGEVKSSPEATYRKGRDREVILTSKERHLSLSPGSQEALEDDKDVDVIEIPSDDGGDALNIKPPQSQAGVVRRDKSHKRKHKADRRRDKQKLSQMKDRDRDHPSVYTGFRHIPDYQGRGDRGEVKDRGPRGIKDARENIRERQKEKAKRQKEAARDDWGVRDDRDNSKEARKRIESLKERERLENMEREKQRERRLREQRERAEKQRRKEEQRRLQQRAEDSRQRDKVGRGDRHPDRGLDRGPDLLDRHRSRGNKDQRRQRMDRDRSDHRDRDRSRKDEDDRVRGKGQGGQDDGPTRPRQGEERQLVKPPPVRQPIEEEEEVEEEEEEEEEVEEPPSPQPNVHSEEEEDEEEMIIKGVKQQHESSSEEESESESNKSSSSAEAEEEEEDHKRHLKSKFDNESEEEEESRRPEKLRSESPHSDEDGMDYVQDTPPMSPVALAEDLPVYLPALQGCRSVEEFHCLNRIEEGTYGVVYRAEDRKTDEIVALKRLKMEKEKEGFPITSLREINTLLKAQHTNIVTVREIVVGSNMDKIYIVMDYVEHDLKSLMETMKTPFIIGEVKTLMKQLFRAVAHLHDNWILHRDLKTSNLLLSHKGILKVGDFGLAREYGSPLKQYTPIVVTLWYRAPELLLGVKEYSKPIDMWSVGCIFGELLTMKALWPGKSEIDQLKKIFKDLGTPTEKIWEGLKDLPVWKKTSFEVHETNKLRDRFTSIFTDMGFDLINKLLAYDPKHRLDAKTALEHKWFAESPLPVDPSMFPTWPARSEQTGRKHVSSPKPPSGGKAFAKLMADEDKLQAGGFHMDTAAKGASAQGGGFQLKF